MISTKVLPLHTLKIKSGSDFLILKRHDTTDYTVGTLYLGAPTTESDETIRNLKLRYEYAGYLGWSLVVVYYVLTGNRLTYSTDEHPGWWREIIDGDHVPIYGYQSPTFNTIGSLFGSNSLLNDAHFPRTVTLRGIVKIIELGVKALRFTETDILVSGSLGGMQIMRLLHNHRLEANKAVISAATDKTSPYSRIFSRIAHETIHIGSKKGLSIAGQSGFSIYRSSKGYDVRFAPDKIVSYQRHQGGKSKESYGLLYYLAMLNVLDSYHLDHQRDNMDGVFQSLNTKVPMMSFIDDSLYPNDQVRAVEERFKYHRHFFVSDNMDYDGFLLNFGDWAPNLCHFLKISKFKRK